MSDKPVKPQTSIFSKGYDPHLSEGAANPPVFRTSTFLFKNAMAGKRAFEIAYGLRQKDPGEIPALIYTRVNNPNAEMVEDRVVAWDGFEAAALFGSGMGAISCTCLTFLRPGDTLLFSDPVYGGTEALFRHVLPLFGIKCIPFPATSNRAQIEEAAKGEKNVRVVYMESPANPTMVLADLDAGRQVADALSTPEKRCLFLVDNTFLGPVLSRPKDFGADIVLYSATKFIGGHSDLIAGVAMASRALMDQIKVTRTLLGSISDPDTAWLILRSLGTLQLRMEKQQENAQKIVALLRGHPKVECVAYPGLPEMGDQQVMLFRKQCKGAGSLISFCIKGGEKEAFKLLDTVKEYKLAVSLGGIETLIEHPGTMTHSDMTQEEQKRAGIRENMIRISVGLEDPDDLVEDMKRALAAV
ncbi:MAG TPA: aminotransferase class I/II-fold pyridoxal phosphate-dependent enzyme [Myxococcales bacterium]|jgi:methionine-gamma-lyase